MHSASREAQLRLVMHLYGRAMAIVDPIRIRMWSEAELTTTQLRILFYLREEPGATLTQVAGQLHVSPPTASGLVDRLVRQRFIRREDDLHDRRYVRHHLTDPGTAIVGEIEREGVDLFEQILSRLPDDALATLIRGLTLLDGAAADVLNETTVPAT